MADIDFSRLNPKERRVLKWRLGLVDGRVRSHHEVGRLFRASARHIQMVEAVAHWKLERGAT